MYKLTLDDIGQDSFQAVGRYNSNNQLIELALDNTLSRDGLGPNHMLANLDLNSYRIINLATPTSNSDAVTKLYVDELVENVLSGVLPPFVDYVAADTVLRTELLGLISVLQSGQASLTSTVTTNHTTAMAAVTSETTARATADSALASRLDVVEASVGSPNTELAARVTSLETAVTSLQGTTATASSVTSLTARVTTTETNIGTLNTTTTTLQANITAEATARATADTALSNRVTNLEGTVGNPNSQLAARITTVENAVASLQTGSATTTQLNTLQSQVNGVSATVTTQGTTLATINGRLASSYGITVDGNGRVASLQLLSNGQTSAITFNADSFRIFNGSSAVAPFEVSGGNVKINGNLVINGTITTASIADNAVTQTASGSTSGSNSISVPFNCRGGRVIVFVTYYPNSVQSRLYTVQRNGSTIDQYYIQSTPLIHRIYFETPPAGATTYTATCSSVCNRIDVQILEMMK